MGGKSPPPLRQIVWICRNCCLAGMPTFFFSYWKFAALSVPWMVTGHWQVTIHYFIVKFQKCSISYRNWTHIIFRQETRWNYQFLTKMVFCALKMEILCFRYNKGMVTCWPPVIAIGPIWVSIIFYHQGQLLVQRGSLSDFPFLRSWGGRAVATSRPTMHGPELRGCPTKS